MKSFSRSLDQTWITGPFGPVISSHNDLGSRSFRFVDARKCISSMDVSRSFQSGSGNEVKHEAAVALLATGNDGGARSAASTFHVL